MRDFLVPDEGETASVITGHSAAFVRARIVLTVSNPLRGAIEYPAIRANPRAISDFVGPESVSLRAAKARPPTTREAAIRW